MLASVIICTRNRDRLLERALRSLARQTAKAERFEIIVIDDGSSDGTARLVAGMKRDLSNMTCISLAKHLGLAGAANVGFRAAKGEFLLFTDDDCVAQEDWVERMTAALAQEPIVAGALTSPSSGYIKLCHNISQFHPFMNSGRVGEIRSIAGANMGIRRSVLQELGGFDARSKTPDTEFVFRARSRGYRVRFAPRAVVLHDPDRTTLTTILKYSSDHASETILLRKKYGSLLKTPFVLRSSGLILMAAPLIALVATLQIFGNNLRLAGYFWTAPLIYLQKLAWCWGAARRLSGRWGKSANATDCPEEEESPRS